MSDQTTHHPGTGTQPSRRALGSTPVPAPRRGPGHPTSRAAFLARTTRSLSGALHTDRAVDLVLELLVEEIADWAQVLLRGRRELTLRSRTGQNSPQMATLPLTAVPPDSVLGRVLATGSTDLVPIYDEGASGADTLSSVAPVPRIRESLAEIRPMDVLTVALSARGTTYGTLTLARRAGEGFDADAVAFLEELADRISVTLDTTRALAESRRVASVLARDLNPPELPRLEGVSFASYYRVAIEQEALGGDFYDVHGSADDWTAVVGDVCGKGVDAAVLTGRVRQSVRTAAIVDRAPARVLDLVNRVLVAEGQETFVTAICARGRRTEHGLHLDLASAGHPRPWVVRRDGRVEQVDVSGLVLGLLDDGRYTEVAVDLAPGETLVLYTDGVPEAPGKRERFGDDRLRDVLAVSGAADAAAVVEGIAVALSTHLGDRPHDDIAILAIQPGHDG
ncbi:MAG: PP2C family protein-serine/threonine phosphatase [Nocardioidaceae bacterium]